MSTKVAADAYQRISSVDEVTETGLHTVQLKRHVIVLVHHEDEIYALDNRCPHMGFRLTGGVSRMGSLHATGITPASICALGAHSICGRTTRLTSRWKYGTEMFMSMLRRGTIRWNTSATD